MNKENANLLARLGEIEDTELRWLLTKLIDGQQHVTAVVTELEALLKMQEKALEDVARWSSKRASAD